MIFLMNFDLKSGYHHLDIWEAHQPYLGFSWEMDGARKYFVFVVLPFGLATACYAFTMLLRPLIRYWRGQGLRVVLNLDDGTVTVKGEAAAQRVSALIQEDLAWLFTGPNHSGHLLKKLVWLGFEIDLELGKVVIPESKLRATFQSVIKRPIVYGLGSCCPVNDSQSVFCPKHQKVMVLAIRTVRRGKE